MEQKENIEFLGGGLKCDNPECDFIDNTIPVEQYESWLNKPCPKCGQNLLTEEDFNNVKRLFAAVKMVNALSEEDLKAFGFETISGGDKMIIQADTHKEIKLSIQSNHASRQPNDIPN